MNQTFVKGQSWPDPTLLVNIVPKLPSHKLQSERLEGAIRTVDGVKAVVIKGDEVQVQINYYGQEEKETIAALIRQRINQHLENLIGSA